jgi:hypothetical protein
MIKKRLFEEIAALTPSERKRICDFIDSLGDGLPRQLSAAHGRMLLKRAEFFKKHPEHLMTWEQVKAKLREQRALQPKKPKRGKP